MTERDEHTLEKILRAATTLLVEAGERDLSLRKVAQHAGVSVGTLTYYFKNKQTLIEATLDALHDRQTRVLTQSLAELAAGATLIEQVEKVVRDFYAYHISNRDLLRLRMASMFDRDGLPTQRRRDVLLPVLRYAGEYAQAQHGMPALEARFTTQLIIYAVARFAVISPEELMELTGASTLDEAERATEEYLVSMARRLLPS